MSDRTPTLRGEYLARHKSSLEAAKALAVGFNRDDPENHKAGYTRPNALLAALEVFPEVEEEDVRDELDWPHEVVIVGSVPVSIKVDLDEGTILKVVVEDEHLLLDASKFDLVGWSVDGLGSPISPETEELAEKVLDHVDEWPAWEFGW